MMASNTDIREWGRVNAPDLFKHKGPPSKALQSAYYQEHPESEDPLAGLDFEPEGIADPELSGVEADQSGIGDTGIAPELPPGTNRRRRRLAEMFTRRERRARAPRAGGPRSSTERLATGVWSVAAKLLNGTSSTPLSRVLALQAPVAGVIIDREIKGTAADLVLQPIARLVNRSSQVGVLFTLPILVQLTSMRPELYPQLYPYMVEAIYRWYEVAGPEMEKMVKRAEKRRAQFNRGDGPSPEELVALFFQPPEAQAAQPAGVGDHGVAAPTSA